MTRAVPEWIGETPDTQPPRRVQLRIYMRHDGRCPKCTRLLQPKKWACDHIVALVNGGENRETNLQPLCVSPCHSDKTKADVALKSLTYKRRLKQAGIQKRRRTIPGRRFNGEPRPARWVG